MYMANSTRRNRHRRRRIRRRIRRRCRIRRRRRIRRCKPPSGLSFGTDGRTNGLIIKHCIWRRIGRVRPSVRRFRSLAIKQSKRRIPVEFLLDS